MPAILFLTLIFGQLQRWQGLYLHDAVLVLLLMFNYKKLKIYRPVLWFVIAGLVSLAVNGFPLIASLYLLRFFSYSLLLNLKIKPKYLLWLSSGIATLGLLQYIFLPDTRFLASLNWDDHYYRLISTLFDPNFTGIILVLGLILTLFKFPRVWWLYLIQVPALLLTYSRSSYLALFAAGFYLAVVKKKMKFFLLGFGILCLMLLALPRPGGEGVKLERLFSVTSRLDNYQEGIKLWLKHPVFGLGFNNLRAVRADLISHAAGGLDSSLLFVLATTGIIGLAAYFNLLKCLWEKNLLLRVSLVALLVHSLFVNSLFYPWVMIWLWSIVNG
jgi:hypothetical protein